MFVSLYDFAHFAQFDLQLLTFQAAVSPSAHFSAYQSTKSFAPLRQARSRAAEHCLCNNFGFQLPCSALAVFSHSTAIIGAPI